MTTTTDRLQRQIERLRKQRDNALEENQRLRTDRTRFAIAILHMAERAPGLVPDEMREPIRRMRAKIQEARAIRRKQG